MEKYKEQLKNTNRSCICKINNYTADPFHRTEYSCKGIWVVLPVEVIPPYTEIVFVTKDKGFMAGTFGKISYSALTKIDENIVITFQFFNTFNSLVVNRPKEAMADISESSTSVYKVECSFTNQHIMEIEWTINYTSNYKLNDSRENLIVKSVERMIVEDDSWKTLQLRTNKSVTFSVSNNTNVHFFRTAEDTIMQKGKWSKMPPDVINPNDFVEFGCRSMNQILGSVIGQVSYNTDEIKEAFKVSYLNPGVGIIKIDVTTDRQSVIDWNTVLENHAQVTININKCDVTTSFIGLSQSISNRYSEKKIFGVPIQVLVHNEEVSGEEVPLVIEAIIDYLLDQGYDEPKLFLLPGKFSELQELKSKMEKRDLTINDLKSFDIHSVCSILKKFLSEIPGRIIPKDMVMFLVSSIAAKTDYLSAIDFYKSFIAELPRENRILLKRILEIFYLFQNSDTSILDAKILSVIFGMIIVDSNLEHNTYFELSSLIPLALENMILYYPEIFEM